MATPNVTQRHPTLRRKPAYGRWIAASYRQGWVAWASDESQPFHEAITVADIKRLEDLLWACSCAAAPRALMHTVHGCAKPLSRARCWHVPCTIRRDFRKNEADGRRRGSNTRVMAEALHLAALVA